MKKTYPSAIDWWIAITLIGTPAACIIGGAILLSASAIDGLIIIGTGLFVAGITALLAYPCTYTLTATSLTIRAGLMNEEIPLTKIEGAEPCFSLWSSPALSLKRVRVVLQDGGSRLISPKDREAFVADLATAITQAR